MSTRTRAWRVGRLPHPALTVAYLRRGLVLWIGIRLLWLAAMLFASVDPTGAVSLVIPPLVAAAGYADLRRRREGALLANLGVSESTILVLLGSAASVGEVVLALARSG